MAPDILSRVCCSALSRSSLYDIHSAMCHPGITRMYHYVRSKNLLYSLDDVRQMTSHCKICAKIKPRFLKPSISHLLKATRRRRRRRLKGIHFRPDTNRTGAEGLSFYYPRLLHCLDQMLAVMLLSQHRVLSSKTVRPRAPCGARCMGHIVSTWSAVCSEAPHSQFGEGARPHLCMDE